MKIKKNENTDSDKNLYKTYVFPNYCEKIGGKNRKNWNTDSESNVYKSNKNLPSHYDSKVRKK